MKYVSIDLETTGLDPKQDQILMIGMYVEDTEKKLPREELPSFSCLVRHEKNNKDNRKYEQRYCGDPFALNLNAWILKMLADNDESKYPIYVHQELYPAHWVEPMLDFLNEHFPNTKAIAAGKNVGSFDMQFFPEDVKKKFLHRHIDPGSIFIDWKSNKPLRSLGQIKEDLNIAGEVTHDALDDAWDVIEVLRTQY
ncbi:MAG: exonuclease domain-containing protein [Candidatus Njordarchaeales archaeon]